MDTRPISIKGMIVAFRQSSMTLRFIYPEDFLMPSSARVEFWIENMMVTSPVDASISENEITVAIPKEKVYLLPHTVHMYMVLDGYPAFGGRVRVEMGLAASEGVQSFQFTTQGDQSFFIEVDNASIISEIQSDIDNLDDRVQNIENIQI